MSTPTKRRRPPRGAQGKPARATEVDRKLSAAIALHHAGKLHEALVAYRGVLDLSADQPDALMNMGFALATLGKRRSAIASMQAALSLRPQHVEMTLGYAQTLLTFGMWAEAIRSFEEVLSRAPRLASALAGLGLARLQEGDEPGAADALERAVRLDPTLGRAYFDLHRALYDDHDPGRSEEALAAAVAFTPDPVRERFYLAVLQDQLGRSREAESLLSRLHPDKSVYRGAVESWAYIKAHRSPETRLFSTTRQTLTYAMKHATGSGLVLEMGVRYGITTRLLAAGFDEVVHGLDSFQGLPENWHVQTAGIYSTHGETPDLPSNVTLHVGTFDSTLPEFARVHPEPLRFLHVDCDLYSSTKTTFDWLGERVVPQTVIVFDEYLLNDRWREDEFKAFQEAVVTHGWAYEYLAFNLYTGQAAVRILG